MARRQPSEEKPVPEEPKAPRAAAARPRPDAGKLARPDAGKLAEAEARILAYEKYLQVLLGEHVVTRPVLDKIARGEVDYSVVADWRPKLEAASSERHTARTECATRLRDRQQAGLARLDAVLAALEPRRTTSRERESTSSPAAAPGPMPRKLSFSPQKRMEETTPSMASTADSPPLGRVDDVTKACKPEPEQGWPLWHKAPPSAAAPAARPVAVSCVRMNGKAVPQPVPRERRRSAPPGGQRRAWVVQ